MNIHQLAAQRRGAQFNNGSAPGLPMVALSGVGKGTGRLGRGVGATRTFMGGPASFPPALSVSGAPSMQMQRQQSGGVVTAIRRRSQWSDYLTDSDLEGLLEIARRILNEARALSQGPLTLHELAHRGHPYGRGARSGGGRRGGLGRLQGSRAGVSNLAVVNKQTGEFAASWDVQVQRSKDGITVLLINTSPVAQYLALGTIRMKAHGPFTTAPARFLSALNQEWLKQTNIAYHRAIALAQVAPRSTLAPSAPGGGGYAAV